MREVSFDGYRRRVDAFDYQAKRRDVPHDVSVLLELADRIDLEDGIIVDHEHYSE
jgi:hypothetical protein